MRKRVIGVLTVAFVGAAAIIALAQTTGSGNPPLAIRSLAGQDLFAFYCASCHGRDGGGNGPVAGALKAAPPDLRLIARRNGGEFPRRRVADFVTNGRDATIAAHGTADMPVWGPVFKGLDGSEALATIRIAHVVQHLESIQTK